MYRDNDDTQFDFRLYLFKIKIVLCIVEWRTRRLRMLERRNPFCCAVSCICVMRQENNVATGPLCASARGIKIVVLLKWGPVMRYKDAWK
jgi:hypothetical protein